MVIGEMTIVSCSNGSGHGFLIYHSFIEDTIDFTGLTGGYTYGDWEKVSASYYNIHPNEYVSIGNAGGAAGKSSGSSDGGDSSQLSESGSSSSIGDDKDDAGVYFNREFAYEYKRFEKEYDPEKPERYNPVYVDNYAYTQYINESQMRRIIKIASERDYYNVITNNCVTVANRAWNSAYPNDTFKADTLPARLKDEIKKKTGSYVLDLTGLLGLY